jgi:SAM-dependent methyltransferase
MIDRPQHLPGYVCPRTLVELRCESAPDRFIGGSEPYPIRAGIPCFLSSEYLEDDSTQRQLAALNRLALTLGWAAALREVYGANSGMVRYVTDPLRASFIELLPLTLSSDVLEIGPGLGQFTPILAHRSRSVSALEVSTAQAEFAAERCRQEGFANVQFAVGGDDCRLPYAENSFDIVVLNLVFEWCASRCASEPHGVAQLRLLREMRRVLRPDGVLYLATKNRFSLHYLLGKADEHCFSMPFGNALPRWLTALVLKARGHGRPPGFLHSYNELQRMLDHAGFIATSSFWAAPEMRYPTRYVSTATSAIRDARRDSGLIQGEFRSTRLLMPMVPAALVKHFTQGLSFLAKKSGRMTHV